MGSAPGVVQFGELTCRDGRTHHTEEPVSERYLSLSVVTSCVPRLDVISAELHEIVYRGFR